MGRPNFAIRRSLFHSHFYHPPFLNTNHSEWLEMEIGITGGEEDGVDNSNVDNASLYTQPEDIFDVYKALAAISPNFSIAAAFGNVHGVYKPGNVVLRPELLGMHQKYAAEQLKNGDEKPLYVSFLLVLLCAERGTQWNCHFPVLSFLSQHPFIPHTIRFPLFLPTCFTSSAVPSPFSPSLLAARLDSAHLSINESRGDLVSEYQYYQV